METAAHVLDSLRREFRNQKRLGEKALSQARDEHLHTRLDPESNSLAVLIRHLAGNMVSRWTDFLTTDGEKPTRDRDGEFEDAPLGRVELMAEWERGWATLFAALDELRPEDLLRRVVVRGREQSALEALHVQLVHYSSHVGQIILLVKHFDADRWQTLTLPRRRPGTAV
jgi:hypothetical protein